MSHKAKSAAFNTPTSDPTIIRDNMERYGESLEAMKKPWGLYGFQLEKNKPRKRAKNCKNYVYTRIYTYMDVR